MALYIKDPKADRLARQLAKRNGETITSAVIRALEAQTARVNKRPVDEDLVKKLNQIAMECAALPDLDTRTPDEILGYDENGLPT
jgi:antitoxin VapB